MTLKRLFCVYLLLACVAAGCLFCGSQPASAQTVLPSDVEKPYVNCYAAILIEWHTGAILYQHNAFKRAYPASLTKMMTALLALEKGRLEEEVRISHEASQVPGSSMHLGEGEVFTLEDLLYGLMLNSGNDAAWAIAEHIGQTADSFFSLMNRRAKQMGAINTQFQNPHGLTDPNHYSTAFDLALIAKTCLKHPYFNRLVATKEKDVIEAETKIAVSLENTNRLLWMYLGADGVKTGTTESAGQCLVASASKNDMRLLAVILDSGDRWADAASLLEYGFNGFQLVKLHSAGETIANLPTRNAYADCLPVVCVEDLFACVPQNSTGLVVDVDLPKTIKAPCDFGTLLGRATVRLGDNVVGFTELASGMWLSARTPGGSLIRLVVQLLKKLVSSRVL